MNLGASQHPHRKIFTARREPSLTGFSEGSRSMASRLRRIPLTLGMIRNTGDTAFDCTTRATENDSLGVFHAMTQNPAATVIADWRQRVNRTFKTVEYMRCSTHRHIKCLVVFVPADLASSHNSVLLLLN
jgi:hypothetical protein